MKEQERQDSTAKAEKMHLYKLHKKGVYKMDKMHKEQESTVTAVIVDLTERAEAL